jgi:hypothetical protein
MCSWSSRLALKMKRAAPGGHRHQERHGAFGGRLRCRSDPRSLRMGCCRNTSVALGISRSVPDEFRKLAEKDL